jgi:tripartite-type tricarboxylate transporter receptor subunit TctC
VRAACLLLIGASLAGAPCAAQPAAPDYPLRPVRLIVAGAPGTPPDTLARVVAEPLAAALGKAVVIENRPGGSGVLAMDALARSAADGHVLGTIGLPQTVAAGLMADPRHDLARDFAPVRQLAWSANVLVVRAASPLRSVDDFVAAAKARPGALAYASGGNGTPSHLASELFRRAAAIDVRHVPYKGIPAGLSGLMGEQVDIAFAGVASALPLIRAGRLRALATAGARRLPVLPELPTIAELGFAGYEQNEWYGVVAPAGTPSPVIVRLAAEMERALALPATRERLEQLGFFPVERSGPAALGALIRAETQRWQRIVRDTGIRAQ